MLDRVIELLNALGYTNVTDGDKTLLNFALYKVECHVKNEINWTRIPKGLEATVICRVVGEFLLAKKTFAPGDLSGLVDLSGAAVKQIQAGDTNYVFAVGENGGAETDSARLNNFINYLLNYGESDFSAFRRIRW